MEYLQDCLTKTVTTSENESGENSSLTPNTFIMNQDTKGVIYMSSDPLNLKQGLYGQGNKGFKLALYKLPDVLPVIMWHLFNYN